MWQQKRFGFQNISKLLQGDCNGSRKGSDQHLVVSSRRPNQRLSEGKVKNICVVHSERWHKQKCIGIFCICILYLYFVFACYISTLALYFFQVDIGEFPTKMMQSQVLSEH